MKEQRRQVPPSLAARPHEPRRNLPIPPVSVHASSTGDYIDFTVVNGPVAAQLAMQRVCSLCAEPMAYWVAFLGTAANLDNRRFLDPPAHPDCMKAAVYLCPFIAYQGHRRTTAKHVRAEGVVPPGYVERIPDEWVLGITRRYRLVREGDAMSYVAAPFKTLTVYRYDEKGRIHPAS